MRNLHQIILQEYGLETLHLFRDWERLWLRASDYKNHGIFTLICIHKDLIPVSIKLKSTIKTESDKKIVGKVEKDLLQARVKAINSIQDNVSKQTELCRSLLASILSTQRLRECQGFIEKVGEPSVTKVKQRQVNNFNNLLNKKEGNITWVLSQLNTSQGLVASQAGRQALTFPLGKETVYTSFSGRQVLTFPQGRKQFSGFSCRQASAHLPSREGSSLAAPQAGRQ